MGQETFSGAYLDNGLGCFVAAEVAKQLLAEAPSVFDNVRGMFAFAYVLMYPMHVVYPIHACSRLRMYYLHAEIIADARARTLLADGY